MSIKALRKVKDHIDTFTPEDHNDQVDNFNVQIDIDKDFLSKVDDPKLDELISKLESIIVKMRKVRSGDFYLAEDHNLFVEAWKLQKEINSLLQELIAPPPPVLKIESECSLVPTLSEESVTLSEEITAPDITSSESVTLSEEITAPDITSSESIKISEEITIEVVQ